MSEREVDQFPDFFGDSVNVAGGAFSITLTFFASEPLRGDKEGVPGDVVGRVRLSPELAGRLAEMLADAVKTARDAGTPGPSKSGRRVTA